MFEGGVSVMSRRIRVGRWVGLLSLVAVLGCGGSGENFPTAAVTGKVTFEGQPVTGGELVFAPISDVAGKPAGKNGGAMIGSDGTFTVSTYGENDGAVIGKHRVVFTAPTPAAVEVPAGGRAAAPLSPYAGLNPKQAELTVNKGENKLEIELVR